jgi:hypothetical protein
MIETMIEKLVWVWPGMNVLENGLIYEIIKVDVHDDECAKYPG